MKIRREHIFNYISYIQLRLGIWDRKLTPAALALLQKVYEGFVNDLPKEEKYILTNEEILKLQYSIISIVSKHKDDQESLETGFKNWNKQYQKIIEEESIFKLLGIENDFLEDPKGKKSLFLKSLAAILLLCSLYFIIVGIYPITIYKSKSIQSFVVTQVDSLTPVSFDLTDLIDFDSIQYFTYDTFWMHKVEQESIPIELASGILYCENSNFGSFEYLPTSEENYSTSFFIKAEKNFWGLVHKQEVRINATYIKESDIPEKDTLDSNVFPSITYQDFPFPNRTLKFLEKSASLEKSFMGTFKWPISLTVGFLAMLLFYFRRKKVKAKKTNIAKAKFGHPYFWKLQLPNAPSVKLCEDVDKKVHLLRSKIPSGRNALNVPQTIHKTVKSGGFVTFQYAEESLKTEYLFLIGYKSQSDHISKLWSEIALGLNAKDINTSVFHYNSDIRLCYSDHFPNGLSLKELYNHYSNSILVIIGEHYNFLNPFTGKLNNWLHVFENWSTRYLLTSKNFDAWDRREIVLGKLFHVLPSKVSSLSWLQVNNNRSEEIKYKPNPYEHIVDYNEEFTKSDIDISFTKVQKDWIAACCHFPTLHYDLSLAIGKVVFAHHEKEFSSTEIEEIFSLSWFSEGQIPDEIRKSLIKDFENKNQILVDEVRSFIANEVKYYNPPHGSHASDWFREGILINELLNKSSKPSTRRIEKIEKELNSIYKRGLESDIQIKPTVDAIKNPPWLVRLNRWLSKPKNLLKIIATLASFIIPYIFLTIFFDEEKCINLFPTMDSIPLNYELSASFFADSTKTNDVKQTIGLCRTELEDELIIFEENILRSDIFLDKDYEGHAIFEGSSFSSQVYNESFRKNIAVDLYNKALQISLPLKGISNTEILQDTQLTSVASLFCEKIQLSKTLINNEDDSNKFEFEDSLAISLQWCTDNLDNIEKQLPLENLLSVGIYGLSKKDSDYNKIINFLEIKSNVRVVELEQLNYSSDQSKFLYFDPNDLIPAEDFAKELNILLGRTITPEFSVRDRSNSNNLLLYIADPNPDENNNNDIAVTDCQICNKKLGFTDNEAPVFETTVKDIQTPGGGDDCQNYVTWPTPRVQDNCELKSLASSKNSGDLFLEGETLVTYTATDLCGNSSTFSFTVNVVCNIAEAKIEINGLIFDASSGKPVKDALIEVAENNIKDFSNALGGFNMNIPEQSKFITISKGGYEIKNVTISNLVENKRIELVPIVQKTDVNITGKIVDQSGKPLSGVYLLRKDNTILMTTDKNGKFSFNIPEKIGSFVVNHPGYNTESVNIKKTTLPIILTLKKSKPSSFEVYGTIVDAFEEESLIGANVFLKGTNIGTASDTDGSFTLTIPEKKGTIEVSYIGYKSTSVDLENVKMPLTLRLEARQGLDELLIIDDLKLRGTVSVGKESLIGANVLIKGTSMGTVTDIDGSFSIRMPSTNETIVISYTGYKTKEVKIDSKYWGKDRSQTKDLNIKMK